jgi:hypothetical protein
MQTKLLFPSREIQRIAFIGFMNNVREELLHAGNWLPFAMSAIVMGFGRGVRLESALCGHNRYRFGIAAKEVHKS